MTTIAFQQLGDAVEFLADNLEKHNYEAIANHCIAPLRDDDEYVSAGLPSARDYRLTAIKALSDHHAEHSLRVHYERWEFPADRHEFKLGGHGEEFGHIHVDFEMTPAGWCLKEVWVCR
jgi:hypothetical protein